MVSPGCKLARIGLLGNGCGSYLARMAWIAAVVDVDGDEDDVDEDDDDYEDKK